VAEGNVVKTRIVELDKIIDAETILDMSMSLNNVLSGVKVSDIASKEVDASLASVKKNKPEIKIIISEIIKTFEENVDTDNIWTYGSNNFFKYKEFVENENVGKLVEAFEQKKDLVKIVDKANEEVDEETGLKIYIGEESSVNAMKNCSVITANCDFGNGMKGTIGVVGPKRMDYEKVLKTIKNTMLNITNELKE